MLHKRGPTFRLSSSMGFERSDTSTWRLRAKDAALFTRPSISAPLKFLVASALKPVSQFRQCTKDMPLADMPQTYPIQACRLALLGLPIRVG